MQNKKDILCLTCAYSLIAKGETTQLNICGVLTGGVWLPVATRKDAPIASPNIDITECNRYEKDKKN